jgi:hypothetical protein
MTAEKMRNLLLVEEVGGEHTSSDKQAVLLQADFLICACKEEIEESNISDQ